MSLVSLFHSLMLKRFRIHLLEIGTYCGFISCVVLVWCDVGWWYSVVRLGWCGILMQAEALVHQPVFVFVFVQGPLTIG